MTVLTPAQAYAYALNAGFTGSSAVIATAIAGAESNYRDDAVGDVNLSTSGEKSVGLWQVNYRPGRDGNVAYRDPQANLDPRHNAAAAYTISGGGKNFGPWSTYTSGAYRAYMPGALAASHAAGDNPALPQGMTSDTPASPGSSSYPDPNSLPNNAPSAVDQLLGDGSLNLNPLDGFGIAGKLKNTVLKESMKIGIYIVTFGGAAALMGLGVVKAVSKTKTGQQLGQAGQAAGGAAALAAL